jgi:F0F1-type ATP synthase membrane subunit b/b'
MSSLQLVPDPVVLATQVGVFVVNVFVMKKLIFDPYLAVREKRERQTVGSKDAATRLVAEAEQTAHDIGTRLNAAADAAKGERETLRNEALAKRQSLVTAAEKEAKAHVAGVEQQIAADLAAQRAKVPATVAALSEELYKIALA